MKKKNIFFLGLCTFFVFSSFSSIKADQVNMDTQRQCCTKSASDEFGNSVQITACAGWFLSNDANAYSRACEKAEEALSSVN